MNHESRAAAPVPLTVIGSINQDSFTFVTEFPRAGETVLATSASVGLGGKGCNQAVAAAKLGQDTRFIGAVGADAAGDAALHAMSAFGVTTDLIRRLDGTGTGAAYIAVNADGENTIIVHSGANAAFGTADAAGALAGVTDGVLLIQGELSAGVNQAVAAHAARNGLPLIANAAPVAAVDDETIAASSYLIVNETEAADLAERAGLAPADDASTLAGELRNHFSTTVLVTLGARGVAVATEGESWIEPAPRPDRVVDTTGAGDAFVGVFSAGICLGLGVREAALRAVTAASQAVTKAGIGESYVTGPELDALLGG